MRGILRPVIEQFIDALRFRDEKRWRDDSFALPLAKDSDEIYVSRAIRRRLDLVKS